MAPNLYVMLHTMVSPSKWVPKKTRAEDNDSSVVVPGQPMARTEHWKSPVPGVYRFEGPSWYLIQLDSDPSKPEKPDRVVYCQPLRRGMLESQYKARCVKARLPKIPTPVASRAGSPSRKQLKATPASSRAASPARRQAKITPDSRRGSREEKPRPEVNFVRHDDEVSWINDKDADGKPTKGPWQRFCLDKTTGEMRPMLKGDDPTHKSAMVSRPTSLKSTDSKNVVSKIKAIAPELDGQSAPTQPAFLGPRSISGSSKTSPRSSQEVSRPTSTRMPSSQSRSPLSSPGLPAPS